jgi:hypothetical protein
VIRDQECCYITIDMIARILLLLLSSVLIFSCSEEKKSFFKKKSTPDVPFLLNLEHYFSEVEDQVSFPIWFDDSIIRMNKIQTVTRNIYALNQDTSEVRLPRIQKIYSFNEDGEVTSLEIIEYYERTKVHHVTFDYLSVKDENGYADVEYNMENHLMDDESTYSLYEVERYANSFLAYKNRENGNYLFFMTNTAHRGPLSVDSIVHPTPNDWVVLGSPQLPEKRYQVQNRVNETSVKEVIYSKGTNHIEEIHFENSPFTYKRTIQYNQRGLCKGFVDSTFSIDQFLMRRSSKFALGSKRLPRKIEHVSEKGNGEAGNRQLETFEYDYYEQN